MSESTLLSVRLPLRVSERLEKLSDSIDRSKSYVAAEAIEEYLDLHEWQIAAIEEGIKQVEQGLIVDFEDVKKRWKKRRKKYEN